MELKYFEFMTADGTCYRINKENMVEFDMSIKQDFVDFSLFGANNSQKLTPLLESLLLVIDDYHNIKSIGMDKIEVINFYDNNKEINEKYEAIFNALNPNDEINAIILDVYDDYAITYNCKKKNYERVYYSKTEDSVNIGDIVKCYIVDVTESEYNALETMKAMNNNTYELINENFVQKSEFTILKEENDKYSIEKEQLQNSNEQLQNSNEQLQNSNKELQSNIELYEAQIQTLQAENTKITDENSTLKNDNQQLSAFKCNVESEQKEQIINKFEEILTDTALNEFKLNKDKYSAEELEKELCLTAFKSNPTIFSKEAEPLVYQNDLALKRNSEMSGCETLIDNYKRNGGNK